MARIYEHERSRQAWAPAAYDTNENTGLWPVEVGDVVKRAYCFVRTAFDGTSPSAALGDDGDVDRYITTTNSAIATADTAPQRGTGAGIGGSTGNILGYLYTAADLVDVDFTAATGSPTTGFVDWWIYVKKVWPH